VAEREAALKRFVAAASPSAIHGDHGALLAVEAVWNIRLS
jgi:hypothetical protein